MNFNPEEIRNLIKRSKLRTEAAAPILSATPPEVVSLPSLYEKLKNRNQSVLESAATTLGQVGDETAIEPLLGALRSCFDVRVPWLRVALGLVLLPLLALTSLVCLAALVLIAILEALIARKGRDIDFSSTKWAWRGVIGPIKWLRRKRSQRTCGVIAHALEQIAERHPGPELRSALPALALVTADFALQSKETRRSAREAIEVIDRLTSRLRSLPRSAVEPTTVRDTLPAPAESHQDPQGDLPRAAENDAIGLRAYSEGDGS